MKFRPETEQPTSCYGCAGPQTSVSIADSTLDGPIPGAGVVTFSTGEPHVWNVDVTHGYDVNFDGTREGTLDNSGPASGTDGQAVIVSADWGGGGLDGTPVTFTLGSQSCTGSVSGGSANCTITLAQPVGSYTLTVSSPGDVSVYPANTSVAFSIRPDVDRPVQEERLEGVRDLQEPGRLRQLRRHRWQEPAQRLAEL